MELKLVPKLSQQLVMTPQLKMAIKLLTLNHLELKDAVAAELIDNPVLDESYEEPRERHDDRESSPEQSQAAAALPESAGTQEIAIDKAHETDATPQIDWEAYAESYSYLPPGAGTGRDLAQDDLPGYDQTLTRSETLEEHLLWQVRMSSMNDLERTIAVRLLGEMAETGYLDRGPIRAPPPLPVPANGASGSTVATGVNGANGVHAVTPTDEPALLGDDDLLADDEERLADDDERLADDDETGDDQAHAPEPALLMDEATTDDAVTIIAEDLDVPTEWVENVRQRMMRFDPVGCLSRNLQECLLVQLDVWGYDDECLVFNMVKDHMHDVERRNYQVIARAYKVPLEDVGDAMKLIEQLEPRPARNYIAKGDSETQQYITPDVYMTKVGEEYVISLNEDGMPKLKISPYYMQKLAEAQRGDPSKTYIKDKMRSATWLIRSIHQRQRTIYRVVESILKFQRDWFDEQGPLHPLILKEVADDIQMHESTVSRVTSRKYLHCHRGIFELKYFFNSSIATQDGSSIASESVKDEIKRIVSGENPKKPLSDAAIVKKLKERNIDIARRTVAKYREMMGILPSNRRKQVF
jgi:RNA polymerase sigma-54 factor